MNSIKEFIHWFGEFTNYDDFEDIFAKTLIGLVILVAICGILLLALGAIAVLGFWFIPISLILCIISLICYKIGNFIEWLL